MSDLMRDIPYPAARGTKEDRGGSLLRVRKAKFPRRCDVEIGTRYDTCGRLIDIGDLYCEEVIPPYHEFSRGDVWMTISICALHPLWWPKEESNA